MTILKPKQIGPLFAVVVGGTGLMVAVPAVTACLRLAHDRLLNQYTNAPFWAVVEFVVLVCVGPILTLSVILVTAVLFIGIIRIVAGAIAAAEAAAIVRNQFTSLTRMFSDALQNRPGGGKG